MYFVNHASKVVLDALDLHWRMSAFRRRNHLSARTHGQILTHAFELVANEAVIAFVPPLLFQMFKGKFEHR